MTQLRQRPRGRPRLDAAAPQREAAAMERLHAAVAAWWPPDPKTRTPRAEAPGDIQVQLTNAVTSGADPTKRPYVESTSR